MSNQKLDPLAKSEKGLYDNDEASTVLKINDVVSIKNLLYIYLVEISIREFHSKNIMSFCDIIQV